MSAIAVELIHPFNGTVLQRWQFASGCQPISIGRSKLSDIRLASKLVSRHHATLQEDSRGWLLESFGANGCYIDGYFAEGEYLRSNSVLSIGRAGPTLRFSLCSNPASAGELSLEPPSSVSPNADGDVEPPQRELVGSVARRAQPALEEAPVALEEILLDRDTWYGDE